MLTHTHTHPHDPPTRPPTHTQQNHPQNNPPPPLPLLSTHRMDTYRPAMPSNMHHQLCPVCMAPHFPFCPPNHAYAAHPPQHEPFHPGNLQYDAFHPHAGQPFAHSTPAMPDPVFRSGNVADFPPYLSYFSQGRPPHFVEDRRDGFSQASRRQIPSAEAFFPDAPHFSQPGNQHLSSNGSMNVDFSRQGGPNRWVEAERDFSLQQQRRAAGMGDRLDSGEGFPSRTRVSNLPTVDANVNMPDNRFERGLRGDYHRIPEDARFERDATKHNFATDLLTGVAMGRNQFVPMGLPDSARTSLTSADELRGSKGLPMHPSDFGTYPYPTLGSNDNGRAEVPKAFASVPGQLNALDGFSRREEGTLAERKLLAHQVAEREDAIPHGRLPLETSERREDAQEGMEYALPKKTLKRKHPMSREEELLIEKGLLDDDLSESHRREPFPYQARQANDHFVTRSKQGGLAEKDIHYKQSGYRSSLTFSEQELKGTNFGQMGEHNNQRIQSLMSQSERNKKEEGATDKGVDGRFSNDWPSEVPWDVPRDSGKSLSLESSCSGVPHPPSSQPSNSYHQQIEEAQIRKDILYRQYQEWEAEEKHLEALRRAERLAREIQQREEGVHLSSSLHPSHFGMQDLSQESKRQTYQHQEVFRSGSAETSSEDSMLRKAAHQHGGSPKHPSLQHPNYYAEHQGCFQEPQLQEQQQLREGLAQVAHNAQPYTALHSRRDGLTQLPASSRFRHDNHLIDREISHQDQSHQHPGWPKEHQSAYKPHLGPQHNQVMPQHNQLMPQCDQQSTSAHTFYPQFGAQELSQKTSDRSAQHGFHYQPMSSAAHDLHGSNPPLPASACVNPPPPDSPPPPPLPAQPPEIVTPPPPPPSAMFPSARPSTLQGLSGHSRDYLQQSLPPDGRNYGPLEPHRIQQPGISQMHMLNHPHFQPQPPRQVEKSKVIDAMNIFRSPGRQSRPDRFVVILRGLPGSGKSYLAKVLRDVEVMNGGSAPRIHSMDDYFTCEVEKEEEVEMASSSLRTKRKVVKRVVEYCYEPEMEEAYRASMLKAFRKTLEEGMFNFVIVDDRNVLIADFAQFWAIAKRSGYEAFVLEAPYSDVKGCAARNVHNFTEQQIQSMADRWESTPSLYLQLDVLSLFRADDLNAQDIIEVDMDADDMERDLEDEEEEANQLSQAHLLSSQRIGFYELYNSAVMICSANFLERPTTGDRWEDKNDTAKKPAASPRLKKQSEELGGGHGTKKRNTDNALSGLTTTYGKKDKFVHWSDHQGVKGSSTGFSIGSSQKPASLVIGPGPAGYNGMSNMLVEGDGHNLESTELKKSNKFVEQLRAEQEAFKAVFARGAARGFVEWRMRMMISKLFMSLGISNTSSFNWVFLKAFALVTRLREENNQNFWSILGSILWISSWVQVLAIIPTLRITTTS